MRVFSRLQAFDLVDQLSSPCFIQNNVVFWIRSCRLHFLKVTIFTREESQRSLKVLLTRLAQSSMRVRDHFQSRSIGGVHVHSLVSRPQSEPCKGMAKTPLEAFPVSSR